MESQSVQLASGAVFQVEQHALTGKRVRPRYGQDGVIVGKRVGRSGRDAMAFVIRQGQGMWLISRVNFRVLGG